jgi:hypothetical protein
MDSQELVEDRLISYIGFYDKKQESQKEKLMEDYFYPNINNLSKSSPFADTGSRFKDVKVYPNGKIPKTRPEKWVKRKKKVIRSKIKKNKRKNSDDLSPINIADLKKQIQENKHKEGIVF